MGCQSIFYMNFAKISSGVSLFFFCYIHFFILPTFNYWICKRMPNLSLHSQKQKGVGVEQTLHKCLLNCSKCLQHIYLMTKIYMQGNKMYIICSQVVYKQP